MWIYLCVRYVFRFLFTVYRRRMDFLVLKNSYNVFVNVLHGFRANKRLPVHCAASKRWLVDFRVFLEVKFMKEEYDFWVLNTYLAVSSYCKLFSFKAVVMRGRRVQSKVKLHILIYGFDATVYNGSLIKIEIQLFAGILKHIQILQQSFW